LAPITSDSRKEVGVRLMNLEQIAHIAEIIGQIAVIVTLVYLAAQVRQGAQILWSESRQAQVA